MSSTIRFGFSFISADNERLTYYLLYLSSFLSPWFAIFPTSAGLYELFLLILITILIKNDKLILPDWPILASLLLIFLGYSVSTLNANQPLEAVKFPLQFAFIITVQATVLYTLTRTKNHLYLHAVALSASLIGILIYYALFLQSTHIYANARLILFFDNPNEFALHVAPATILSLYLSYDFLRRHRGYISILFAVVAVLGTVLIILSQSRRVFIYLIIGMILTMATISGKRNSIINFVNESLISIGIILVVGSLLYYGGLLPETFVERLNTSEGRGSLENRIVPIVLALRYFSENILIGAGYNNFTLHLEALTQTDLERRYSHKPHNMLIIPFVEGGILAGIGVLSMVSLLMRRTFSTWKSGSFKNSGIISVFVICAVSFILAQMFGVFSLLRLNWLVIFLALIAINIVNEGSRD